MTNLRQGIIALLMASAWAMAKGNAFPLLEEAERQLLAHGHTYYGADTIWPMERIDKKRETKKNEAMLGLCRAYTVDKELRFGTSSWMQPCDSTKRIRMLCEVHSDSLRQQDSGWLDWNVYRSNYYHPGIIPYFAKDLWDSSLVPAQKARLVLFDNVQFTRNIILYEDSLKLHACGNSYVRFLSCIAKQGMAGVASGAGLSLDDKLRLLPYLHYLGWISLDKDRNQEYHPVSWQSLDSLLRLHLALDTLPSAQDIEQRLRFRVARSKPAHAKVRYELEKNSLQTFNPWKIKFACDYPIQGYRSMLKNSQYDMRVDHYFPDLRGCPAPQKHLLDRRICFDFGNTWMGLAPVVEYPWGEQIDFFAKDTARIDRPWKEVFPWLAEFSCDSCQVADVGSYTLTLLPGNILEIANHWIPIDTMIFNSKANRCRLHLDRANIFGEGYLASVWGYVNGYERCLLALKRTASGIQIISSPPDHFSILEEISKQLLSHGHSFVSADTVRDFDCSYKGTLMAVCRAFSVDKELRFGTSSAFTPCHPDKRLRVACEVHSSSDSTQSCRSELFHAAIHPYMDITTTDPFNPSLNRTRIFIYDNITAIGNIDVRLPLDSAKYDGQSYAKLLASLQRHGLPGLTDKGSSQIDERLRLLPYLQYLGYISIDKDMLIHNYPISWKDIEATLRRDMGADSFASLADMEKRLRFRMQRQNPHAIKGDSLLIKNLFPERNGKWGVSANATDCQDEYSHYNISKNRFPTASAYDLRADRYYPDMIGCTKNRYEYHLPQGAARCAQSRDRDIVYDVVNTPWGAGFDVYAHDTSLITKRWESVYPWLSDSTSCRQCQLTDVGHITLTMLPQCRVEIARHWVPTDTMELAGFAKDCFLEMVPTTKQVIKIKGTPKGQRSPAVLRQLQIANDSIRSISP